MLLKSLLKLIRARGPGHLRQRLHKLSLRAPKIVQLLRKHIL
jgi:hypothetical protein